LNSVWDKEYKHYGYQRNQGKVFGIHEKTGARDRVFMRVGAG